VDLTISGYTEGPVVWWTLENVTFQLLWPCCKIWLLCGRMVGPTNLVACPLRCGGTFDRRTCLLQGCRAMVDVGQEVWASVGSLKMGVLGARP